MSGLSVRFERSDEDDLKFLHEAVVYNVWFKEVFPYPTVVVELKRSHPMGIGGLYSMVVELSAFEDFSPYLRTKESSAIVRAMEKAGILELLREVHELARKLDYKLFFSLAEKVGFPREWMHYVDFLNADQRTKLIIKGDMLHVKSPIVSLNTGHGTMKIEFWLSDDKLRARCITITDPKVCDEYVKEILSVEAAEELLIELLKKLEELSDKMRTFEEELYGRKLKDLLLL